MGFFADDYGHQVALRGLAPESPMKPWSLYDFGAAPKAGDAMHAWGAYPWWIPSNWRARFFRPVTSVSLWFDHVLFDGWAIGYHLTSLVIFAALLVLLFHLFRATGFGDGGAIVAVLMFACTDSVLLPVGWPANRNSLLEFTFLVGAALAASRAGRENARWAAVIAVVLGIGAVLSKESGIAAFVLIPLFFHHTERQVRGGAKPKVVPLAAVCMILAAIYLGAYIATGRGTQTAFYPMPWNEPAAFISRLLILIAVAPLSFLGYAPVDVLSLLPQLAVYAGILCVIPGALLCAAVWKRVRPHPAAALWLAWMVVTILPQGTPPTSDRLLFGPAIGAAALLSIAMIHWSKLPALRRADIHLRRFIVIGTLIVSPLSLLASGSALRLLAKEGRAALLKLDLGEPTTDRRELIFLQGPNDLVTAMAFSTLAIERGETNFRAWPIQLGGRGLRWTRIDERTFDFETLDDPFFTNLIEIVFLNTTEAPPVGTKWKTALFSVEALERRDDRLTKFRVTFHESPDEPRMRFYAVDPNLRFERVSPPSVGSSIDLPRVPHPITLLDLAGR